MKFVEKIKTHFVFIFFKILLFMI